MEFWKAPGFWIRRKTSSFPWAHEHLVFSEYNVVLLPDTKVKNVLLKSTMTFSVIGWPNIGKVFRFRYARICVDERLFLIELAKKKSNLKVKDRNVIVSQIVGKENMFIFTCLCNQIRNIGIKVRLCVRTIYIIFRNNWITIFNSPSQPASIFPNSATKWL